MAGDILGVKMWFELHPVTTSLITFTLGGIIAFIVNYILVINKLSFIEGQLTRLIDAYGKIDEIIENHAKIEAEFLLLKKHILNGSYI